MKILIDLTSLADNFSGIERFAACLSLELIKAQSHEFILLFKESIHPLFEKCVSDENIKAVVLPRCNKLLFNQIRLPWAVYKIRADCYVFLAFPVPILLFKQNMISTIHDICCWDCPETMNHLSSVYFRLSHRVAMSKCRNIITISRFSEGRMIEKLHFNQKKIWMIYCGVDQKFLHYQSEDSRKIYIRNKYNLPEQYLLSLSTLEPRKNLALLVRVYERLVVENHWDIPLVLAGRKGWKMDDLLSGIPEEVAKLIQFTGFIEDEDLPAVYANAKLFVFPSMYEGFGIPPLEAIACGTPVLSSDAASLPEVLGEVATYFENNNEQSLYETLKKAILSENSPEQICAEKLQAARFDWGEQANILLEKLQKLPEN